MPTLHVSLVSRAQRPMQRTVIVVQPNASLSVRQAWLFMLSISGLSLGVALYMAWLGYWPVLPFAGVELAALGAALWVSVRKNAYREVLTFDGNQLTVEFGMAGRNLQGRLELARGMTRVLLEPDFSGDPHLILSSAGQRLELGRCLGMQDRLSLHKRLRELLRPGWQNTRADLAAPAASAHLGE